jgi:hypothetical protein
MEYDIRLGLMATDAISELTRARSLDRLEAYRSFLEKSANYCRSLRHTYGHLTEIPPTIPLEAQTFLAAIMKTQHPSPRTSAKLEIVNKLEPLIEKILTENRVPTKPERLEIARGLYQSSAASWL